MSSGLFPAYRVLWMPLGFAWRPSSDRVVHCCGAIEQALQHLCEQHPTPFDCPDTVLVYNEPFNEYGIPVRDGGESYLIVTHCPWCGLELPESRRDAWFDAIDALGLGEAPFEAAIPDMYLTAAWRTPGLN
jgi:hypothetical protein